jgi:AcrR family transcriptional regulator
MTTKRASTRLSREQWLDRALEVLAAEGPGKLNIEHMAGALGVSRGSFYWHFKDRADFIRSLLDYWHEIHTAPVPALMAASEKSGKAKLRYFLQMIHNERLTRFDMPLRIWAATDPTVADKVSRTDKFRMDYVRSLFEELGFEGSELDIRARACVAYLTLEGHLFDPASELDNDTNIDQLCDFLGGDTACCE